MNAVTGQTLFAYHPAQERYPASTVKIMTAIVALQHLKLKAVVKVHADAAYVGGTTAGLSEGEQLKVRSLLYGMLLPSGNDAATTLGDAVAGSSWKFAQMMNAEAGKLHLWHTHFVSPTGLDQPGEYTTARDLAWLGRDLLQNQILAEIVHTKYHVAQSFYGQYFHRWTSINQLLWTYRGAIGVKTGTTDAAGANLVAAAKRGGHRIIVVVMGDSKANRFGDATALLNYGWSLEGL
jgi:D-alanyl-D-alanine carboxypeptidase (penicillin-binding protein 5/6)